MSDDIITITVKSKGVTETAFISATFKASVTTTGQTGPAAKNEARTCIEAIKKVITDFSGRAGIETDRLRTSFSVDVWRDRNTGGFRGYQAVYTISFDAKNVSEATALHDALTSITGVESPTPVFNVDNAPEVRAKVFEDAVTNAKTTFFHQCKALGYNHDDFKIVTWTLEHNYRGGGKFLSISDDGDGAIEVSPGRALLEETYHFQFQERVQA